MDFSRDEINFPDIGSKKKSTSDFKFGLKTPLKAKSHSGSGAILNEHLLQAGRMALTVSESVNVPSEFRQELRRAAFIGGIFHDVGKAAAGFQEMLRNFNVGRWPPQKGGYRHEMLSAIIFLANSIDKKIWIDNKKVFWSVYLSIIVHHKPYRKKSTGRYPKIIPISQWPDGLAFKKMYFELLMNKIALQKCWSQIIDVIKADDWGRQLIDHGWISETLAIPPTVAKAVSVFEKFMTNFKLPGYSKGLIDEREYLESISTQKSKFISYVRASVTVGDHLSSGNYLFLPPIPDLNQYPIFDEFDPRQFQDKCRREGHLLLRAPTGSGKTEAAQHWLQRNQHTSTGRLAKVFFVLPFQASINAMFSRLGDWIKYDKGLIGLQHSRAAQILFGLIEEELYEGNRDKILHDGRRKVKKYHDPWSTFEDIRTKPFEYFSDLFLDEGYQRDKWTSPVKKQINTAAYSIHGLTRENFYPIKITTPHQLLGAVLQGRGWEVSVQEFEEACFVFDEIHVYDPHLTGLILGMASVLIHQFNAKVMFMSASFPTFLIELIKEYVTPGIPLIELDPSDRSDADVLNNPRHIIKVENRSISEICGDENFIQELIEYESILLICDTVSTAQNVYNQLQSHRDIKPETVMLFHSRFKMEDRKQKENKLRDIANNNIKFVVATQVVEVSLDIDLAFGIFEAAPLDAITQRLGRVNRKGKRELDATNIIITQPEGFWKYVYDEDITMYTLDLLRTIEDKAVSEMELVELIDTLYTDIPWDEHQWSDFKLAYGNDKYQDFFSTAIPGTYSRWIDEVIVDNSTNDVLHWSDLEEYEIRQKKEPLRALDLLIPARVSKQDYTQQSASSPKVLTEDWIYSSEIGLQKEETA